MRRAAAVHPACAAPWWARLPRHRYHFAPRTSPTVAPRASRRLHARPSRCALSASTLQSSLVATLAAWQTRRLVPDAPHESPQRAVPHVSSLSLSFSLPPSTHTHFRTPYSQRPGYRAVHCRVCGECSAPSLVFCDSPSIHQCIYVSTTMRWRHSAHQGPAWWWAALPDD
jgi:hypothetical protein